MRVVTLTMLILLGVNGCRGWTTDKSPVHPELNMYTQHKYKPYRESKFFADTRDMRPIEEGTVARGHLNEDAPLVWTKAALESGREQFNIYCAPCHSQTGNGDGMVGRRLAVKPTNLHSDYMHTQKTQHFVDVITNGIRTMPSYKHQIPPQRRREIAVYIRALQLSQDVDGEWVKELL